MIQQLKRLGGDSLLYAFMNVGTKIIAFIMFPIYTHFLPNPAEYGVLDYIEKLTSMLTFLVIFGTDSALAFYYFDTKDEEKKRKYVQNVMLFRLGLVVLFFFMVVFFGEWLSEVLLESKEGLRLLYLSVAILFFDSIGALILTVLRYEFQTIKVVVLTVLKMLLIAVLSYVFLKYLMRSIEGILISRIIGAGVIVLFLWKYVFRFIKFSIDKTLLEELLKYGAPLVPASVAFWVIANSNVFFLKEFASFREVGIYGTATKFASFITLLTSGVQMAWRPYSMSLKENPNNREIFAKVYMAILLLGSFGVLLIATIMPKVILLLTNEYYEAYKYVAPVSAVTFLNFYYLIISVGIFFNKETKYISYAFGVAAIINVFLNLIFIPLFSVWGTVIAYLVSYIAAIIFIFQKSQKSFYIPVSSWKMSYIFLTMLASVFIIIFIQENNLPWFYILAVWAGYIILLGLARVDKEFMKKPVTGTN